MTTTRRGFLGAMLAACAGPAIVRAESLMKVVVPRQDLILPPEFDIGTGEFTLEAWIQPIQDNEWHHHAVTRTAKKTVFYLDGKVVRPTKGETEWIKLALQTGNVGELKVFRGVR